MPLRPKPDLTYQSDKDLDYKKALDLERYYYEQAKHQIHFIQQAASLASGQLDDLYGEVPPGGSRIFASPVTMPIYFKLNPDDVTLTRYGFDAPQDVIIVFSIAVLEDLGVDYTDPLQGPKVGDLVDFLVRGIEVEYQYRINDTDTWDFFGNTNFPLHIVCAASRKLEEREA